MLAYAPVALLDVAAQRLPSNAEGRVLTLVFDRRQVFNCSLNLDIRSVIHNTEIGDIFTSAELAEMMAKWFEQGLDEKAFRDRFYGFIPNRIKIVSVLRCNY